MLVKVFTLLGRAGCGKGTQAKLLVEKFGFTYIGSGDLLRARVKESDFTGQKTGQTMKAGDLAPTFLIFQLWLNRLEQIKKDRNNNFKGIIFDGSPRKLIEARLLEEALDWYEWDENFKVLLIDISREEAFDRLTKRRQCAKCGQLIPYIGDYKNLEKCDRCGGELAARTDDNPEAINERLDLFEKEVMPVVEYYERKGLLIKINGEQTIEKVQEEILEKIK